jgi:hypothetical protein
LGVTIGLAVIHSGPRFIREIFLQADLDWGAMIGNYWFTVLFWPLAGPGAVLSDTADHLRTSLKPMLAKLRIVFGIA